MIEFLRKHWTYLLGALLLHVLFAGVFGLTLVSMSRNAPPPQLAIQAVVVDESLLGRVSRQEQLEREREQARAREQAAAERRREQEETARLEAEQRAEQERQIELKQRQDEDQRRQVEEQQLRERQEADRKRQAEETEKQRRAEAAEAERKRAAAIERKQKEEAERRRAAEESKAQAAREAQLQQQLEEEEGRAQAENAGLRNQYSAMIQQRIVRNWNRPPSARPGLECEVRVTQAPNGTVLNVQLGECNGDAAVRQSIEVAVARSSPLPPPPDRRLFERNFTLVFKPLD